LATRMQHRGRWVAALVAAAVVAATANSAIYPLWKKNYAPQTADYSGLSPDQLLFAFAGFRELIAGILWVRADSYFDEGNYDAILPIVRLVTLLDPHQIDVYATGMWHIGYNFTDEGSRSDRRYIPSALALGIEGAKNNDYTYEMFYEVGWMWFHKIDDDYDQSVRWLEQAIERPDMIPARRNLLNNCYQRAGQVDKALEYTYGLLQRAEERMKTDKEFGARQNRDTIEQNLDNLLVRMSQRGYFARGAADRDIGIYDTDDPFDVGFSARVTVVAPKVITVQGTWRVQPVGTRIRFILRDADYPKAVPGGMVWDQGGTVELTPPRDRTFLQDQLFVRNQTFNRKIDMSRDLTMYPFTNDEYVMEFYYNPRSAATHIQDKFGWNGEGMTDKNFLNTSIREGQRVIFATLRIKREQLLRRGEWEATVPVVATANFRGVRSEMSEDDLITVPGLRDPRSAVGDVPQQADKAVAGQPTDDDDE
jgi:hypothetical protein